MTRYFVLALLMAPLAILPSLAPPSERMSEGTSPISRGSRGSRRLPDVPPPAAEQISPKVAREINRLVQQLSSSSFAAREAARHRLEEIGNPAVPALRAATGQGTELELRRRAEQLLGVILTKDLPQRFGETLAAVEKILPSGWRVTRTISGSTPPDWWCRDPKAGFLVEARNGGEVAQIWFLPLDWVGIRKTPNRAWCSSRGQGIVVRDKYKIIAFVNDEELRERLWCFGGDPSLVNCGYDSALRLFAGKIDVVDRRAAALVRKHCRTPKQFREAISSLNDLGIPARHLFLRAVRQARGEERGNYTSILGLLGGDEAIGLLCDIATDLEVSAYRRKYAVLSLWRHQDKRIGPALHTALKQMPDGEGLDCVVKELTHRRYKPAEADLLVLFKRLPKDAYAKGTLAQSLAAFRCKEAIPELRRCRQELQKDRKKHFQLLACIDLALLRLTGNWGEPGESARLFVVPPETPHLGAKMELTVHLENTGTKLIEIWPFPLERGLRVDGKTVYEEEKFVIFMGPGWHLDPGELGTFTCDLTPYVKTAGRHQVQYVDQGARSNVAAFTVRAAKP